MHLWFSAFRYTEIVLEVFLDCHKKGYIEKVLKKYGMLDSKLGDTPEP